MFIKIIGYIFLIFGLTAFITTGILYFIETPTTKTVKCYDRYSNEIIGQNCQKKDYGPLLNNLIDSLIIQIISIIMGFVFIISDDQLDILEKKLRNL